MDKIGRLPVLINTLIAEIKVFFEFTLQNLNVAPRFRVMRILTLQDVESCGKRHKLMSSESLILCAATHIVMDASFNKKWADACHEKTGVCCENNHMHRVRIRFIAYSNGILPRQRCRNRRLCPNGNQFRANTRKEINSTTLRSIFCTFSRYRRGMGRFCRFCQVGSSDCGATGARVPLEPPAVPRECARPGA